MYSFVEEGLSLLHGSLFFALIFYSVYTDIRHGVVPNGLVAIALLGGLLLAYLREDPANEISLQGSLVGCGLGFGVFFLAYLVGGMGAGDAKLMAGIGALTGWTFTLWVMLYAALLGLPLALGTLLWKGDLQGGLRRSLRSFFVFRWPRLDRIPPPSCSTPPAAPDPGSKPCEKGEEGPRDLPVSSPQGVPKGQESAASQESPSSPTEAVPITIPYAVAILGGSLWTIWLYLDRGARLPFF